MNVMELIMNVLKSVLTLWAHITVHVSQDIIILEMDNAKVIFMYTSSLMLLV